MKLFHWCDNIQITDESVLFSVTLAELHLPNILSDKNAVANVAVVSTFVSPSVVADFNHSSEGVGRALFVQGFLRKDDSAAGDFLDRVAEQE